MGRDRRTSDRGDEPRWISQHLEGSPTPRASEIVEATPDTNLGGGGTVRVLSTRPEPGAEVVVAEPAELAEHTDDDSHVRVTVAEGGEQTAELVEVEPVEPLVRDAREPVEGAPPGSPPAPLEGPPDVEPVDNGPGSEGSLDAPSATEVEGVEDERPDDADPGTRMLTAAPGEPGSYEPEVHGDDRPSSIAELNERVTVADETPWPEGAFLPYGNGKRAHWHGSGWTTGESPGYAAG
jgi:hypothetical protein